MKINEMIGIHSNLQKAGPLMLLIRHAEKYVVQDFRLDSEQKITTEGELEAKTLGANLSHLFPKIEYIKSSPVERCKQTGYALTTGLNHKSEIIIFDMLDADGVYVQDVQLAKTHFIDNKDPISVFRNMLSGKSLAGMNNVELATAKLLQTLLDDLDSLENPAIYITHDSILALFVGTLINKSDFTQENWFKYLEGVCIQKGEQNYQLYWGSQVYDITAKCQKLLALLHNSQSDKKEIQTEDIPNSICNTP